MRVRVRVNQPILTLSSTGTSSVAWDRSLEPYSDLLQAGEPSHCGSWSPRVRKTHAEALKTHSEVFVNY